MRDDNMNVHIVAIDRNSKTGDVFTTVDSTGTAVRSSAPAKALDGGAGLLARASKNLLRQRTQDDGASSPPPIFQLEILLRYSRAASKIDNAPTRQRERKRMAKLSIKWRPRAARKRRAGASVASTTRSLGRARSPAQKTAMPRKADKEKNLDDFKRTDRRRRRVQLHATATLLVEAEAGGIRDGTEDEADALAASGSDRPSSARSMPLLPPSSTDRDLPKSSHRFEFESWAGVTMTGLPTSSWWEVSVVLSPRVVASPQAMLTTLHSQRRWSHPITRAGRARPTTTAGARLHGSTTLAADGQQTLKGPEANRKAHTAERDDSQQLPLRLDDSKTGAACLHGVQDEIHGDQAGCLYPQETTGIEMPEPTTHKPKPMVASSQSSDSTTRTTGPADRDAVVARTLRRLWPDELAFDPRPTDCSGRISASSRREEARKTQKKERW
ncbi:hypothetical protein HDK77DRAFT_504162 [Phyllosticta capitalensis]